MDYKNILLETEGSIAFITINRPEVFNALNFSCVEEIKNALKICLEKSNVKCVVFTGKGSKAFIAGADIKELQARNMYHMLENDGFQELFTYINNFEKPTIAMVDGFALGGGCELAIACDIRIATKNSIFGFPELNLSILPAAGGTQRLAQLVGSGNALYMILTGENISANRAKEMGLVNEVVAKEALREEVEKVASNLSRKSSLALKLAKHSIKNGLKASEDVGLMLEKVSQALLFASEDRNEGMAAFLEKRKPKFIGK